MLLPRLTVLLSALVFATCLAERSNLEAGPRPLRAAAHPSKLDYLVLASIADSPHWLSLAGYRSQPPKTAPAAENKRRSDND
jgi:hypothetical protein